MPVLTLSQTAIPFPFALLGAQAFAAGQLGADLSLEWARDGQTALLDGRPVADVAELGHLLKGKEVRPLPLSFTFGSLPWKESRSEYGKGCRDSLL